MKHRTQENVNMVRQHRQLFHTNSLRGRLLLQVVCFLLPILIILLISTMAMSRSFEHLMQDHVAQTISPFAAEIDSIFTSAMRYVANMDVDLSFMNPSPDLNELDVMNYVSDLSANISDSLSIYEDIEAIFLCDGEELWFVQNYNRSYLQNQKASEALKMLLTEREDDTVIFQQGFQAFSADGSLYFFIASETTNGICGCWFNQTLLLDKIRNAGLSGLEDVLFAADEEESEDWGTQWDSSEYFVTEYELSAVSFSIVTVWHREIIFSAYYNQLYITIFFIVVAYLLFLALVFSLHRSVMKPLARMAQVMQGFHGAEPEPIVVDPREPTEVKHVYDAMNVMICNVKALKIQVYEEQLLKQKTEMQLYQAQLRPHFFLNALNRIITFAQEDRCDKVEQAGMSLAVHFKYLLYHKWYVLLEEELCYTRNYVKMQENEGLYCRYGEKTDEDALDYEVPILCIQAFVENAFKYGRNGDNEIRITVTALLQDENKLYIAIDDTGNGFSEEMLDALRKDSPEFQGHGVGIANVKKRLNLLYGKDADISFTNNHEGGAHIEMLLPLNLKGNEE